MVRFGDFKPHELRQQAHLSTRGWTLQEQILSRRNLHCLDSELHWQCRCEYKTQSGQVFHGGGLEYGLGQKVLQERGTWYRWVEDYSMRRFTVASDRLPAFAGISDYYQSITGNNVVLGIRLDSLASDLSWTRFGRNRGRGVTNAPSWSWMSCDAQILTDHWSSENVFDGLTEHHVSSEVCHVDWTGLAMASSIRSTTFIVTGPVKQLDIQLARGSPFASPPNLSVRGKEVTSSNLPMQLRCTGQFDEEMHPGDVETSYTCLLLMTRENPETGRCKEIFLMLAPGAEIVSLADDDAIKRTSFRRVGVAAMRGLERTFADAEVRTLELS